MNIGKEKLAEYVELVEACEYDYAQIKLQTIYLIQTSILEGTGDYQGFYKTSEKLLNLNPNSTEQPAVISGLYEKRVNYILNTGQAEEAAKSAEQFLQWAAKVGEESDEYYKALKVWFFVTSGMLMRMRDVRERGVLLRKYIKNSRIYERITKKKFGQNSVEYLEAMREVGFSQSAQGLLHEAYKTWLSCLDISKEVYGSENNEYTVSILLEMAISKATLKQYEDSINILEKSKKIQAKISSKVSPLYKKIMYIEDQILKAEEKFGVKKPASFFTKGGKIISIGVALAVIGGAAFLYLKKKK